MAVRAFDGVDDRITLAVGDCATLGQGAFTLVFLVKVLAQDGSPFWLTPSGGGSTAVNIGTTPFGFSWYLTPNGSDYQTYASSAAGANWTLVAVSKAAGTVTPRGHRYVYDTTTWSHADGSGSLPNAGTTSDTIYFGYNRAANQYATMRLAAVALYDTVLSDGQLEGLTDALADWDALNPVGLWALNQAATTTAVEDLTGAGADETALTGTSVVTGDDPPGFDFDLSSATDLVAADATHAHTADQPALTQVHVLVPADATHGHTAEQPTLTQLHVIAAGDAGHPHSADQPAVTQLHQLAAADATHNHTADQATLQLNTTLAAADASHGHSAESPAAAQVHVVTASAADHAHAAEQAALTQLHQLVAADARHGHGADVGTVGLPAVPGRHSAGTTRPRLTATVGP